MSDGTGVVQLQSGNDCAKGEEGGTPDRETNKRRGGPQARPGRNKEAWSGLGRDGALRLAAPAEPSGARRTGVSEKERPTGTRQTSSRTASAKGAKRDPGTRCESTAWCNRPTGYRVKPGMTVQKLTGKQQKAWRSEAPTGKQQRGEEGRRPDRDETKRRGAAKPRQGQDNRHPGQGPATSGPRDPGTRCESTAWCDRPTGYRVKPGMTILEPTGKPTRAGSLIRGPFRRECGQGLHRKPDGRPPVPRRSAAAECAAGSSSPARQW